MNSLIETTIVTSLFDESKIKNFSKMLSLHNDIVLIFDPEFEENVELLKTIKRDFISIPLDLKRSFNELRNTISVKFPNDVDFFNLEYLKMHLMKNVISLGLAKNKIAWLNTVDRTYHGKFDPFIIDNYFFVDTEGYEFVGNTSSVNNLTIHILNNLNNNLLPLVGINVSGRDIMEYNFENA